MDVYRKALEELAPYLYEIWLFNWGESFLHKQIFEMVREASDKNVSTTISTNLNFFPEGYEDSLVDSRLERLVVSFDGTTQENYEKYRKGGDLQKVLTAVDRIQQAKRSRRSELPFVKLQFLANRFNENEIEKAHRVAAELRVELEIKPLMFDATSTATREKWEPRNPQFSRYRSDGSDRKGTLNSCSWLWKYAVIDWRGIVTPCCHWIEKGHFDFGDLRKNAFREIWNNEYFVSARKALINEKVSPATSCHICRGNPPEMRDPE